MHQDHHQFKIRIVESLKHVLHIIIHEDAGPLVKNRNTVVLDFFFCLVMVPISNVNIWRLPPLNHLVTDGSYNDEDASAVVDGVDEHGDVILRDIDEYGNAFGWRLCNVFRQGDMEEIANWWLIWYKHGH